MNATERKTHISVEQIERHLRVQNIARATIQHLKGFIGAGVTEAEIAHTADQFMRQNGITNFWYYDIGAFVLVGKRTPLSLSGRDYTGPTQEVVGEEDIVTVDLAPAIDNTWGDLARTLIISGGKVVATDVSELKAAVSEEYRLGMSVEEQLHAALLATVTEKMTFDEIYRRMNAQITAQGFENLDFHGNLGHTIVEDRANRTFIEAGDAAIVGSAGLFTFEPHIRRIDTGKYGFKRENIYYFHEGKLHVL